MSLALLAAGTYMRDSALAFDPLTSAPCSISMSWERCSADGGCQGDGAAQVRPHCVTSSVAAYTGLPGGGAYGATRPRSTILRSSSGGAGSGRHHAPTGQSGFVETPLTAKNDFDMPFIISAEEAAKDIVKGLKNRPFRDHLPLAGWRGDQASAHAALPAGLCHHPQDGPPRLKRAACP